MGGVNDLVASRRVTVLSAGITTTRVDWHPQSSIKQNIDAALITVRNRRVDLVQLFDELFFFIFRFCELALEPVNDDRRNDRQDCARHDFFLAIPRLTV